MSLFRRPRPEPPVLVLQLPRLDGSTWPDEDAAGRRTFDSSTYYEMGTRQAYEPECHEIADRLVTEALPRVVTGASAEDAPYLRKTLSVAGRIGAGIGVVDRGLHPPPSRVLEQPIAAALWQARRGLPAMRPDWARTGAWFLLSGHFLARRDGARDPSALAELLAALDDA